ncbi:hypothetical protein [uncultured Roseibium sp.]|uniref:hypothetical protein n=1 Tax=uncultured Roseibium sp. TaxID=1936171 RepID=UPI00260F5DB7|nr:hypothetical protein [uncultured Roseibium sp.]
MNRSVGEKIGRFLEDYFPELLSFVGLAGIAILDIFNHEIVWLFIVLCLFWAAAIIFTVRRKRSSNELLDQCGDLSEQVTTLKQAIGEGNRNFFDVWNDRARSLFQDCALSKYDRLSIYKHDTDLDKFRLLGRYAENNSYRKRGRNLYPMDEGVIGHAWQHGEHFEKALPHPDRSWDRYVEINQKKYGISPETCQSFNMKSACLWGISLSNEKDVPFALVVIESTKRENLDQGKLSAFFGGDKRKEIENLLDHLEFMEPNLRLAQEMGF